MISGESRDVVAPTLAGLVLAGGKSVRMGHDKSRMGWHGKEQRYYMADMLRQVCGSVFISCRADQQDEIPNEYATIADAYEGSGPLVAILSAFKKYPETAWLVTACDLPLLDLATLNYLIANRDASGLAIWEPASYAVLLAHAAEGFSCPRKAQIRNSDRVKMLAVPDPLSVTNANTPEDAQMVRNIIGKTQG